MSLRLALFAALPACLVQEIDLRTPPSTQPLEESCLEGQRYSPVRSGCVHCETLEHPSLTCPCGWDFRAAGLPYCDTPEAYYQCLPCTGDITSCNGYEPTSSTASDCYLLERCCTQLAGDVHSTPCCSSPNELHCALEPGEPRALVGCLPPSCCPGTPCPGGDGDCEPWQVCVLETCTPACRPSVEVCDVVARDGDLECVCNEAIAP